MSQREDGGQEPEPVEATEDAPPEAYVGESGPLQDVLINEEAENQKANRALRATYADKAYFLASACIIFWAFAISSNAIVYACTGKQMISDTALIAITTGVTINVLAAFLGVIRGLFPSEQAKKPGGKKGAKKEP
ncbi:hypothetical protein [Pseudoduganella namucuonensis]|uniref:Uncharacterized protein n=1 Tax=Pseudoduganella namucuonensis TaxID=1035707 RepID=A0A1I7LKU4_9BURK|nr:hypothetical protein [Pseudoduganella namucuonensis]SFV10317.1 hypothetical protein SAMN05216552_103175 [Pseudoduganella namucuonensis]